MAAAKLIVDGREYEVPEMFTLGEARVLKRFTGLTLTGLAQIDPSDPDMLAALVLIAMRRHDPAVTEAAVDGLSLDGFELRPADEEDDAGPPAEAPGATAADESSGDSGTTPENSGLQPSPESMA